MLPPEAAEYFRRLCSKRFADLASDFSRELREFERDQAARGQFGGSGYVARMAGLYEKRLKAEAKAIVAIQREVHVGFGSPLDAGVGEQLQAWGLDVLDNRYEAMQGSFVRELGRFSIPAPDLDFAHTRALAHVTVANMIADDLWTMRNVPMSGKKPEPGTTINNNTFSGPVGVVQQGGSGNVASATQEWSQGGDSTELLLALSQLRGLLGQDSALAGATTVIGKIETALKTGTADRGFVKASLSSLGATIQTVASLKPAWEFVKEKAALLGILF